MIDAKKTKIGMSVTTHTKAFSDLAGKIMQLPNQSTLSYVVEFDEPFIWNGTPICQAAFGAGELDYNPYD